MDLEKSAKILTEILGLKYPPIAVKFFEKVEALDGFKLPGDRRYCQILMGARGGQKLMLTADNIACPAAAWALGFKEPPPKLSSGEMPAAMGIFASPAAVRNTLATMPRLEMGKYQMVACSPLGETPFEPDVVVLESAVEHLMWVALANVFRTAAGLAKIPMAAGISPDESLRGGSLKPKAQAAAGQATLSAVSISFWPSLAPMSIWQ